MSVRVLITRRLPAGDVITDVLPKLFPMLTELRAMAARQPGYISGETLRNVEDPREYLIISTWKSVEDWHRWMAGQERATLEAKVDALLGAPVQNKIYTYD